MGRLTRRAFVGMGLVAASSAMLPHKVLAALAKPELKNERKLSFYALNTEEKYAGTYWADGQYIPDALADIQSVLRDHRNDEQHEIDLKLLDLLVAMRATLRSSDPIQVISGYRSPQSNGEMREEGRHGVAAHSYHMVGQAIDLRIPGRTLRQVHDSVLLLAEGGVGIYSRSNFVHIDVGPVRHW